MKRGRAGFTLIEILIVSVLGLVVVLSVGQILVTNRRTYTAQSATVSGQQTTRMAVEVLFAELREVSPSGGDILAMGADSIRVRLMRKFSIVCAPDITGSDPVMTVIKDFLLNSGDTLYIMGGSNRFAVGDSLFVYADNDPDVDNDDSWISASVSAVDSTGVACPQDGDAGLALTFGSQMTAFTNDSVHVGAPVRSFQDFTFGITTMLGDVYLGRRQGSGDMIPVAGPLRDRDGLAFVYRDALGAVTADPLEVAQIEVTVRTGSEVLNSLGEMVSDSVLVWIHTRN